jgi:poly(3-hydroxybutyrate) depolymerase
MAYQLVHNGVVREFEFHAPFAWQYWHERVFTEAGHNGLPLVIALHGGGQDPQEFANSWNFFSLINTPDEANWQDRFFVLYPYGFDSNTLLGAIGVKRSWNTGFSGEYLPVQGDASFIRAAIAAVEEMLQSKLDQLGITRPPIDPDRRFVFGYSAGGMMAYKLAHETPEYLAAMWVMAGAYGGRSHEGLTTTVTNDPQGRSSLSLFAHHGESDTVVPPGPQNNPTGRVQPATVLPPPLPPIDLYVAAGIPVADVPVQNGSFRHLAAAIEEFRRYNDCETVPVASESGPGRPDINGGVNSRQYVFRQPSGAVNPEVTVYRDDLLAHTNYFDVGKTRYFSVADVWRWFKDHPRIPL